MPKVFFEEIPLSIAGARFGFFSGNAVLDNDGQIEALEMERNDGRPSTTLTKPSDADVSFEAEFFRRIAGYVAGYCYPEIQEAMAGYGVVRPMPHHGETS
jgi:hypothetical protein